MLRLQRSPSLNERDQGRRALKNRRLPLALIVRAFSALMCGPVEKASLLRQ
jgi:hypothetical protein